MAVTATVAFGLPTQVSPEGAEARSAGKHSRLAARRCAAGHRHRRRGRCARYGASMRLTRRHPLRGDIFALTPKAPGGPATLSLPLPLPAPPVAAPSPVALGRFLSVSAREFSLSLSRPAVAAGDVTIELRNRGEDPHNLVVSPAGSHTELARIGTQDPLGVAEADTRLPAGAYYLWCALPGHEAAGMHAALEAR